MTEDVLMNRNHSVKYLNRMTLRCKMLCLLAVMSLCHLRAQDALPLQAVVDCEAVSCDTLFAYGHRTDTIDWLPVVWPSSFRMQQVNVLTDSLGILHPFWEKLRLMRAGDVSDTVRVVHVGDSHIRGHMLTDTVASLLRKVFTNMTYRDFGINGAFCISFTRKERVEAIAALRPDLLILSFGTNESHNYRYNTEVHYRQMDELVRMLRERLPDVPMMLTTPPGSYESKRRGRGRRTYTINPRTSAVVKNIIRFADANGLAVWDLYDIAGGVKRACLNWQEAGLMRPDHVHFMPAGYALQGELLYEAIVKTYNAYVEH